MLVYCCLKNKTGSLLQIGTFSYQVMADQGMEDFYSKDSWFLRARLPDRQCLHSPPILGYNAFEEIDACSRVSSVITPVPRDTCLQLHAHGIRRSYPLLSSL